VVTANHPLWDSLVNQEKLSARFEFGTVCKKHKKHTKPPKIYCCGGAEESAGGDGDAAATVEHAAKGGDGEEEDDVDAAAAFAHAEAPVEAPSAAAAGLYGKWRGYRKSCCCADQRRLRKDQVSRRNSVAAISVKLSAFKEA
jgi:hypothetical protein